MNELISKEIIDYCKIGSLPKEDQVEMIERFGRIIYQAILVKSLDILSEKEQTSLDLLLDEDKTTTNDVLNFLKLKIPTFDILLEDERMNLKDDLFVSVA
ncbi:MAG: hypothetical protein EXS47_02250 [Candidatus Zambryskibacteria bacterium]|nr:hypothetical protein [Candidatus Zambryskibacteria bacterium]